MKTTEQLERIYDLLVSIGGAPVGDKENFIYKHSKDNACTEWRFCGRFGFGGKYRGNSNSVDYYREDHTTVLNELRDKLNFELKGLTIN